MADRQTHRGSIARHGVVILGLVLVVAGCGGEEEPELTFEERLGVLEGEPLTPLEVAERAEVGEAVCRLDDAVLDALWLQLDDDQLEFQDIVFATLCPDRSVLYARHTGRFVTEEAELSGVVTITTRPPATTADPPTRPSSRPTTTLPTGSGTTDGSGPSTSTGPTTGTGGSTSSVERSPQPSGTDSSDAGSDRTTDPPQTGG